MIHKILFCAVALLLPVFSYADVKVPPAQKTQIEQVVHNYLIQNPEVVVQSLEAFQKKQMDSMQKMTEKTRQVSPQFVNELFKKSNDPIGGNPKGTLTVTEFMDYQCLHCVEMGPALDAIIKANPDIRFVFKELPIRGPLSEFAARAALAAQKQGKFFQFHQELVKNADHLNKDVILKLAESIGLNLPLLKADMESAAIKQQIQDNYKLAQQLGLIGTPDFFIAKTSITSNAPVSAIEFVPGRISQDQLQSLINKIRQN